RVAVTDRASPRAGGEPAAIGAAGQNTRRGSGDGPARVGGHPDRPDRGCPGAASPHCPEGTDGVGGGPLSAENPRGAAAAPRGAAGPGGFAGDATTGPALRAVAVVGPARGRGSRSVPRPPEPVPRGGGDPPRRAPHLMVGAGQSPGAGAGPPGGAGA